MTVIVFQQRGSLFFPFFKKKKIKSSSGQKTLGQFSYYCPELHYHTIFSIKVLYQVLGNVDEWPSGPPEALGDVLKPLILSTN